LPDGRASNRSISWKTRAKMHQIVFMYLLLAVAILDQRELGRPALKNAT
jgi:hypothetical protein